MSAEGEVAFRTQQAGMVSAVHGLGGAFLFDIGIDDGVAIQVDDDVMIDGDDFLEIPLADRF